MNAAWGTVYCPRCGRQVDFEIQMSSIQLEGDLLWVRLYDPKPKHKCERGN